MGKINCFHCAKKCKGDVLKVGDKYFHKECFTCKVCHKKMDESGFFSKDNCFYCPDDYKKYCAAVCFSCQDKIVGEVVTALNHSFHRDCFKCSICQKNFTPGDRVSMKYSDFLCNECSNLSTNRDKPNSKTDSKRIASNDSYKPSNNGKQLNSRNQLDSISQNKDSDSYSVPIRRKVVPIKVPSNNLPSTNSLNRPNSSHSHKFRPGFGEDNNTEYDSTYGNSLTTPKHFHIPPGNNKYWMYNSMVVGTKNHPLALSAGNINKISILGSNHRLNEDDLINKENVKKLSSYPSGHVREQQETAIDRDDWPCPPASSVLLGEKNRRKIQNPTVEALSAGTTPKIRKAKSATHSGDANAYLQSSKMGIAEVLKRSTTDCSSYDALNKCDVDETDIPRDPISASRSPNAVCEPLVPPRYDSHIETSPSRNDDFFKQTERHLGYSMEFVNSTGRSFTSENAVPNYRKTLRNSYVELRQSNNVNHNGTINSRGESGVSNRNDYSSLDKKHQYHSAMLTRDSDSFVVSAIPYNQLRISNRRIIKHLDRSRLETYISDEEFYQLFNLSRPAFYQLPEWKRNDLKKQVDLF